MGCVLAGLEDDRVPGRERSHGRRKKQLQGVVPGGQDEHHAAGLAHDARASASEGERQRRPPRCRPRLQMPEGVRDLAEHDVDLGEPRLPLALSQIGVQRRGDRIRVRAQQASQRLQATTTHGQRGTAGERGPGTHDDPRQITGLGCRVAGSVIRGWLPVHRDLLGGVVVLTVIEHRAVRRCNKPRLW